MVLDTTQHSSKPSEFQHLIQYILNFLVYFISKCHDRRTYCTAGTILNNWYLDRLLTFDDSFSEVDVLSEKLMIIFHGKKKIASKKLATVPTCLGN